MDLARSPGHYLFHVFGLMAVVGALTLVFSKNAVHSIVGFLLAMLSIAGCYLTLSAEFLAVAQLLVYAGGIVVLFLFVVMLVEMTKYKEKGLFQVQCAVRRGGGDGRGGGHHQRVLEDRFGPPGRP